MPGLGSNGPAVIVLAKAPGIAGIPSDLDGIPVIVKVTDEIRAFTHATGRFPRPVPTGVSTGHPDITAGTIECRVIKDGSVYALSNNHVYANENDATIGDNVLQPGTYDGGTNGDEIGTLADFEPIVFKRNARNKMDVAIALSSVGVLGNSTPPDGYGIPNSAIVGAVLNQSVQKFGRTTELTKGVITGVNATVNVSYGTRKTAKFVDQIIIEPGDFSAGGDSGSLIVTDDGNNNPVALLFAGSSSMTIANRIDLVLERFGVTIDGEVPPPPTFGSIGGTVTSGGNAISGATVSVETGQSATTAGDGSYNISGVPTGDRSVTASATGFVSQTTAATVSEGQTTTVDFDLVVDNSPTLSVAVSTDKSSYGHRETVQINVTVTDGTTPVSGAAVHVEIATASGKFVLAGDGTTDANGVANFTHKVNSKRDGAGTNTVDATASKAGFTSGSGSTTFLTQ